MWIYPPRNPQTSGFAVQRQVIAVFAAQDMCHQRGANKVGMGRLGISACVTFSQRARCRPTWADDLIDDIVARIPAHPARGGHNLCSNALELTRATRRFGFCAEASSSAAAACSIYALQGSAPAPVARLPSGSGAFYEMAMMVSALESIGKRSVSLALLPSRLEALLRCRMGGLPQWRRYKPAPDLRAGWRFITKSGGLVNP